MEFPILNRDQWAARLAESRINTGGRYFAMYSSWWGGFVQDPALMVIPIDDHMVHRGDGVFEALRAQKGRIFDIEGHLFRLKNSAEKIGLKLPSSVFEIGEICQAAVKLSGVDQVALRIFVGRGPGSFSPNPYDSKGSQLYVVATEFKAMNEKYYDEGASACVSAVPQKGAFFSQIKSCNYLMNVLMKKEAVDRGVDFSLGVSEEGILLEGPTENLAMVNSSGELVMPRFDHTLRGTTLIKVIELARKEPLPDQTKVRGEIDFRLSELLSAREVFMVGTTLEVLPVVKINDQLIGLGRPGPVARELRQRLQNAMSL